MLKTWIAASCMLWCVGLCCGARNLTKLHLLGLFPMTGVWAGGTAMSIATELALRDINDNVDILSGYEVVLIRKDSGCDGGTATNALFEELYNQSTTKMMIIGAGCSIATEPTAQASHHWNLIQMSISSSPLLSNRAMFPLSFRLMPPESNFNIGKLALFKKYGWKKVATLCQSVPLFSLSMADLHRDATELGIEIIAAESFVDSPGVSIENIKNVGARIIVVGVYSEMARKVFCEVYRQKMYSSKYVWIVTGWLEFNWWREPSESIDCTPDQMDKATANQFGMYIDNFPSDQNSTPSVSGLTTSGFLERFKVIAETESPESMTGYTETTIIYDTVWTAALALHQAQTTLEALDPPKQLEDFSYDEQTAQIFYDIISNLTFEGISGPVRVDRKGDRLGLVEALQLQDGTLVSIGVIDPTSETKDLITDGYQAIFWPDGAPPIDFMMYREDNQTIHIPVFIAGVALSLVGTVLASSFLAFNIHFRKLRVIKMSSPKINNLMLIGGLLAYVSIIFLGVDTSIASTENFVWMCKAKTWCLSFGFSIAFGSLFSKTWRVHKIFTNKTAMKLVVKDSWLIGMVMTLVAIDTVILILWEIVDPVSANRQRGTEVIDEENDDIVHIPIRMMCESVHQIYFIGAFYIINGLLLIFGAFLAWETRKVTIPALNDSKYIGVCIYNVLILSFVGAMVSFVVENRNTHYALLGALIWLSTTITLCIVFVPKIKTRNDVAPAKNTTMTQQGGNSMDMQRENQLLRREIFRLKNSCKCQAHGDSTDADKIKATPSL
ncbi:gamma-aminobutyric acid type B receptor subunit 1-like [Asterias rubens]|uniref:gamma-aminobutyric acid type B receptor subunit 1-like n=1 Tax=Asterias rubens TaxID=7604 RepID=UPI0014556965|nr:gamma-aminobutyric acid type B receptor subunit 1-like [Asterias rubens]